MPCYLETDKDKFLFMLTQIWVIQLSLFFRTLYIPALLWQKMPIFIFTINFHMVFIYFFFFIQKKFSQTFNSLDLWLSLLSYSRRILFNPLNA